MNNEALYNAKIIEVEDNLNQLKEIKNRLYTQYDGLPKPLKEDEELQKRIKK